MRKDTPLVTIICATYNHEKYIAEALESFVNQKTNFPFEIIVHDDASVDNTVAIIKEYESKYPTLFANIYQKENQLSQGIDRVTKITFQAARGKYIALCEGDDYWIDANKLQKQVDALEANPNVALCFHNAKFLRNNILEGAYITEQLNQQVDLHDFIKFKRNIVPTASLLMRNNFSGSLNNLFGNRYIGDWYLQFYQLKKGNFFYIDECLSAYRIHNQGLWSSATEKKQLLIFYWFYKDVLSWLNSNGSLPEDVLTVKNYLKDITYRLFTYSKRYDKLHTFKYILLNRYYKYF